MHGRMLRPVHPVKRSRGRDSRMTTPSGRQSREISPPSCARDRRASKNAAKPFVVWRGGDRGSAAFRPREDKGLTVFRADNFDLPLWRRERSIFCGICPKFVQQKRELDSAEPEITKSGPAIVSRSPCASSMSS